MHVEKTLPEWVDFTNYGIDILFFGFFLCSTKLAALGYIGLPFKERARLEPRGRNQNIFWYNDNNRLLTMYLLMVAEKPILLAGMGTVSGRLSYQRNTI